MRRIFISSRIRIFIPIFAAAFFSAADGARAAIDDPAPAHQGNVDFEQAVHSIVDRSTDITIQKTKVTSSEYTVTQRKTTFLPTLGLVGVQQSTNPPAPTTTSTSYTAAAALNLFRGGADVSSLRASQKDLDSNSALLNNTNLATEENGVEAVASQIEKQLSVDVLAKQVEQFRSYVKIAQERYAQGLLASQEVDKIIVDMQNLEAHQMDFQSQLVTAKASVARLLGHSDISPVWPWKTRATSNALKSVVAARFPLEQRPDYRAAFAAYEAEQKRANQNLELMLPTLDLGYSYGYPQTWAQNPTGTATLTLTAPLFEGLAQYAPYKIQQQTAYAAEARLRQVQRDALSDWQSTKDIFEVTLNTALSRDKTLSLAQKLYQSSYARFKQGRASANDLQIDQTRLTDAETLAILGWSAVHTALSKLCHSLGRSVFSCE